MKPNRMKEKMARGEPALGCSVMFPSPQVVEMLGYAGFDWVLIDAEHGLHQRKRLLGEGAGCDCPTRPLSSGRPPITP